MTFAGFKHKAESMYVCLRVGWLYQHLSNETESKDPPREVDRS